MLKKRDICNISGSDTRPLQLCEVEFHRNKLHRISIQNRKNEHPHINLTTKHKHRDDIAYNRKVNNGIPQIEHYYNSSARLHLRIIYYHKI